MFYKNNLYKNFYKNNLYKNLYNNNLTTLTLTWNYTFTEIRVKAFVNLRPLHTPSKF